MNRQPRADRLVDTLSERLVALILRVVVNWRIDRRFRIIEESLRIILLPLEERVQGERGRSIIRFDVCRSDWRQKRRVDGTIVASIVLKTSLIDDNHGSAVGLNRLRDVGD